MTLKEIKFSLKKVLANFGQVETDKGVLEFVGEEMAVGSEVYINSDIAPDGEYLTPDGKTIVVEAGLIKEIKEPVTEEPVAMQDEAVGFQAELDEIKSQLASLVEIVDELASRLEEIETKLAEPVEKPAPEEFKKTNKNSLFRN